MNENKIIELLDGDFLEEEFNIIREKVRNAIDASPNNIKFEDALKQVRLFNVPVV